MRRLALFSSFALVLVASISVGGCDSGVTTPPDQPATLDDVYAAELQKASLEPQVGSTLGNGPMLAAGGPSSYGYTWIDSNEPGGPTYDWVDITGLGTAGPFTSYQDDYTVGPVSIGFDFPFYGTSFSQLYVCTNGWVSFTNNTLKTYTNQTLPNAGSSVPENLLAVYWDDMVFDPSDGNYAYHYYDGTRFILTLYIRRIATFDPPYYKVQIILYPDGRIVYQYDGLGVNTNSATIGIQNGTKTDGLTVAFNTSYVHEDLAILFNPPVPVIPVDIDIKPGSELTCIKAGSKGNTAVAILGSAAFDTHDVDPVTVSLGGIVPPLRWSWNKDVNLDGYDDLVLHFSTQEMEDAGLLVDGGEVMLTGETLSEQPIAGSETVYLAGGPTCH